MKLSLILCTLGLIGIVSCSPIVKRETNEISPINEVSSSIIINIIDSLVKVIPC